MINYIKQLKLRRAFDDYLSKLGPTLNRRYGVSDQYTVMQVEKTAAHLKLNMSYIPYAIALYRHEESKNTINLYRIDQDFLNILRNEIANAIFDGDLSYTAQDAIRLGSPKGWRGGRPNGWVTQKAMWHTIGHR